MIEPLLYWVAGFFCAYLVVRSIRSLWAGGFCFLLLTVFGSQAGTWTLENTGASGNVQFQVQPYAGAGWSGAGPILGPGQQHIENNGLYSEMMFRASTGVGFVPVGGVTISSGGWFGASNDGSWSTNQNVVTYTNFTNIECWTNTTSVSVDVAVTAFLDYSGVNFTGPNGETGTVATRVISSDAGTPYNDFEFTGADGGKWRVPPGGVICFTNDSLVPVEFSFTGPGGASSGWEGVGETNQTTTSTTVTNTVTGNGTNVVYNGGSPTSASNPDPFSTIPGRPGISSSNANDVVQRSGEGIVLAISDSGSRTDAKLEKIYGALTNMSGFGGAGGDSDGDGLNDVQEDLLRVIATNTTAMSNFVVNATNLSGLQGLAESASNNAVSAYAATNSLGGYATAVSNVNWGLTNGFSFVERAPSSLLRLQLGQLPGGVMHELDLDPNQSSDVLEWLFSALRFTRFYGAVFVGVGLFWVMYREVQDYTKDFALQFGRWVKLPSVTVTDLVGRATYGLFLVSVTTTLIGMLPWLSWAFMSGMAAWISPMPDIDLAADVSNNFGWDAGGVMKETALKFFWGIAQGVPFVELIAAFVQWCAFRFYMPWLFGFVLNLAHAHGILVIGRCVLPFLLVIGANGAQVELHNLTGTNVVWTNASRTIAFPPGETRIDIEPGWYLPGGAEVVLSDNENIQVLRFSQDENGALVVDGGFATSPADYFWYGFAAGFSLFGTVAAASVIKAAVNVGVKNNVWVPD